MKISDLIAMCARNLTRRKFRTFLTVMGVVVGTSFIVLMISLGIAISENNQAMLESWGDLTMITINNRGNTELVIDDSVITQFNNMPGVDVATPMTRLTDQLSNSWPNIYAGRKDRYELGGWSINCMEPVAIQKMGFNLLEGEWLDPGDQATVSAGNRKIKVLISDLFAYGFYDTKKRGSGAYVEYWEQQMNDEPLPDPFFDPWETEMFLVLPPQRDGAKTLRFELEVVGVLENNWRLDFYEDGCIISIEDMNFILEEFQKANNIKKDRDATTGYTQVKVKCLSIDDVAGVEQAIRDMGYPNVYSMEQERQSMQESAQQLQLILGIIGGVALFISAISIMNTMIMSVYERTREIGVMKVLGCVLRDIRSVFLIEAALIGFFGGVIGDALSYGGSFLLNKYGGSLGELFGMGYYGNGVEQKLSVVPPWLLLLGLVFATCVGLVSGILPAMRAVKISALEAIRTE